MIQREYLKEVSGIVKDIFIPRIYDEDNGGYLLDSEVDLIGFNVLTENNKELRIVVNKDDNTTAIYVEDKVIINFYKILYDYDNYRKKLYEKIYLENSDLNDYEIKRLFYNELVSEEEFNKEPKYINEYEITLYNE